MVILLSNFISLNSYVNCQRHKINSKAIIWPATQQKREENMFPFKLIE
jgi:hypothetical protein